MSNTCKGPSGPATVPYALRPIATPDVPLSAWERAQIDRRIAEKAACEEHALREKEATRADKIRRGQLGTGFAIGDRVQLVDISQEQRFLLGRLGTVADYATGGSGLELTVVLDVPWTARDPDVTLPAWCWAKH